MNQQPQWRPAPYVPPRLPATAYHPPQPPRGTPYPAPPFPPAPPAAGKTPARRWVVVAIGGIAGILLFSALASGGGSSEGGYSDTGYSDSGSAGQSGGSSQIYDGGSITTGDHGEIIYSDDDGNGFSSGG